MTIDGSNSRASNATSGVRIMIAAILKDPPAWHELPAGIPPALRALLVRLLEKDPRRRLRDIGDARLALEELLVQDVKADDSKEPALAMVHHWPSMLKR